MKRLIWSSHPDSSPGSRIVSLTALWVLSCLVGALALHGRTVHAQQAEQLVAVVHGMQSQNKEGPARNQQLQQVLAMPLAIDLNDVALSAALDEVAKRSGMRITYSRAVVPFERRVTVRSERVTLGDALTVILDGTNAVPELTPDRQIVIMRSSRLAAMSNGTITGRVIHAKTKQPVAGATISVTNGSAKVVTGNDGRFQLSVPIGNETIHVRAVGFVRQAKDVTVTADATVTLEVVLEPSASVLDEVVVTGTVVATERKAIPNPITVITAEEIERRGITRVEQLLRGEVPGVIALERGDQAYGGGIQGNAGVSKLGEMVTSEVYVRGASALSTTTTNPLKTYIDGVELTDPSLLGTIDPQSIERIEIITGPQAATVYGSGAMGGVMQIFTKKGQSNRQMELTLNLRYGMLESKFGLGRTPQHNHAINVTGGSGAEFSFSGNVSYGYTGQWQPGLWNQRYGASIGATHARDQVTGNLSLSTTRTRTGVWGSEYGYGNPWILDGIGNGLISLGDRGSIPLQRIGASDNQTVSVSLDYRPTSVWNGTMTLGRSQNDFDIMDQAPHRKYVADSMLKASRGASRRSTVGLSASVAPGHFHFFAPTMSLGINGSWGEQMSLEGCLPGMNTTTYMNCPDPGRIVNLSARKGLPSESWGGYGRLQMGFFEQLYVTFGLRGERNPAYGRGHKIDWTPNNGIAYTFDIRSTTIKFLGSYGRATRPPDPQMRELVMSNPSATYTPSIIIQQFESPLLTPEYSRGPQMGVEMYFSRFGSLVLNHYRQKVTDLIQRPIVDSIVRIDQSTGAESYSYQYQYLNAATIRQQGWEATGSFSWHAFSFKGTYSWSDSRVLSVHPQLLSSTWYIGRGHFGIPSHTMYTNIGYAHGNTAITLTSSYVGRYQRRSNGSELSYLRSYGRLNEYLDRRASLSLSEPSPGYVKSDLSASHRITQWSSLTLHVQNLTDSYATDANLMQNSLGRQTLLGLSLRYPRR